MELELSKLKTASVDILESLLIRPVAYEYQGIAAKRLGFGEARFSHAQLQAKANKQASGLVPQLAAIGIVFTNCEMDNIDS